MGKVYSDFYFANRLAKIEILPNDKFINHDNVVGLGDQLILVARPIGTDFAARRLVDEFTEELQARLENKSILDTLVETTKAFNFSLLHPPAEPELIPDSQCFFLAAHIDSQGKLSFVQVGDITLKTRKDGRFIALTKTDKSSLSGSSELECHRMSDITL